MPDDLARREGCARAASDPDLTRVFGLAQSCIRSSQTTVRPLGEALVSLIGFLDSNTSRNSREREVTIPYLKLSVAPLLALILMLPSVAQALNIELNFTGSSLFDSGFIPPDTMGAAGPDHFVELLNGRYWCTEDDGGRVRQAPSIISGRAPA
jgi:hypothetical protein